MKEISSWMKESGPQGEIVLGSRCRLARNLQGIPFPDAASRDQLKEVLKKVSQTLPFLEPLDNFNYKEMASMDSLERELLVEEHLVSPKFIQQPQQRAVVVNEESNVSIMVNEEDHLRIQVLYPGLQLEQAWQSVNEIDDALEKQLDYAYEIKTGYLTSCPTNVGTALRASVMLHLPALRRLNKIQEILGTVSKFGLTVRGMYGEGSDVWGNVFQLSNQFSLGHSEEETIDYLMRFTDQVLHSERQARGYLLEENRRLATEDWLYRSYGILSNARTITSQEAMELLSDLKLGVDLEIIKINDSEVLKQLVVQIRSAHLQQIMGQSLPVRERDRLRASLIREALESKVN